VLYYLYFLFIKIIGDSSPHTKSAQFINRKHDVDQPFSSSSVPTTSAAIQQPCNRKFYSQGLYKLLKIIDVNNNIY